jgi:hypothetical protein
VKPVVGLTSDSRLLLLCATWLGRMPVEIARNCHAG